MKGKGKKAGAATGPSTRTRKVRFILDRPARSSDFPEGSWARDVLERVMGPGVQARIKADAAMPVRFPGNDGILFDPNWQDDIIAVKPASRLIRRITATAR